MSNGEPPPQWGCVHNANGSRPKWDYPLTCVTLSLVLHYILGAYLYAQGIRAVSCINVVSLTVQYVVSQLTVQ